MHPWRPPTGPHPYPCVSLPDPLSQANPSAPPAPPPQTPPEMTHFTSTNRSTPRPRPLRLTGHGPHPPRRRCAAHHTPPGPPSANRRPACAPIAAPARPRPIPGPPKGPCPVPHQKCTPRETVAAAGEGGGGRGAKQVRRGPAAVLQPRPPPHGPSPHVPFGAGALRALIWCPGGTTGAWPRGHRGICRPAAGRAVQCNSGGGGGQLRGCWSPRLFWDK